jgi:polysaccharide deacetylase family protein (PEP-CTERM system associated)
MKNALSIDLEDWFCVHNFADIIPFSAWDTKELRVRKNTELLLDILDRHSVKATFFVLGWIAKKAPDLIKEIAAAGHEIASHGYGHLLTKTLTPATFEKDLTSSLEAINACVPNQVIGFRAPSFSIDRTTLWVFDILTKYGIRYDSSIFPISFHPDYGERDGVLSIYKVTDSLTEFPMSCFKFMGMTIPCCGGGYFRLFPYGMIRFGIKKCNHENRPAVFYLHPWEIDPGQPRVTQIPRLKRFRHYYNIGKTAKRLDRLLSDFEFGTVAEVLGLA